MCFNGLLHTERRLVLRSIRVITDFPQRAELLWLWSRRALTTFQTDRRHIGGLIYMTGAPRCSVLIRPAIIKNNNTECLREVEATQNKCLTLPLEAEGVDSDSRQSIWYILMNLSKKCGNLGTICQRLWSLYWCLNIDDKAHPPCYYFIQPWYHVVQPVQVFFSFFFNNNFIKSTQNILIIQWKWTFSE